MEKHLASAAQWAALRDRAAQAASLYEEAMTTRQVWQRIADPTLRIAQAADLELRRRDPWARWDQLTSLESESDLVEGNPDAMDADVLAALGLTPEATELSAHPQRTAEVDRRAQARLDELATLPQPEEDHGLAPAEAWAPGCPGTPGSPPASHPCHSSGQPSDPQNSKPASRTVLKPSAESGALTFEGPAAILGAATERSLSAYVNLSLHAH